MLKTHPGWLPFNETSRSTKMARPPDELVLLGFEFSRRGLMAGVRTVVAAAIPLIMFFEGVKLTRSVLVPLTPLLVMTMISLFTTTGGHVYSIFQGSAALTLMIVFMLVIGPLSAGQPWIGISMTLALCWVIVFFWSWVDPTKRSVMVMRLLTIFILLLCVKSNTPDEALSLILNILIYYLVMIGSSMVVVWYSEPLCRLIPNELSVALYNCGVLFDVAIQPFYSHAMSESIPHFHIPFPMASLSTLKTRHDKHVEDVVFVMREHPFEMAFASTEAAWNPKLMRHFHLVNDCVNSIAAFASRGFAYNLTGKHWKTLVPHIDNYVELVRDFITQINVALLDMYSGNGHVPNFDDIKARCATGRQQLLEVYTEGVKNGAMLIEHTDFSASGGMDHWIFQMMQLWKALSIFADVVHDASQATSKKGWLWLIGYYVRSILAPIYLIIVNSFFLIRCLLYFILLPFHWAKACFCKLKESSSTSSSSSSSSSSTSTSSSSKSSTSITTTSSSSKSKSSPSSSTTTTSSSVHHAKKAEVTHHKKDKQQIPLATASTNSEPPSPPLSVHPPPMSPPPPTSSKSPGNKSPGSDNAQDLAKRRSSSAAKRAELPESPSSIVAPVPVHPASARLALLRGSGSTRGSSGDQIIEIGGKPSLASSTDSQLRSQLTQSEEEVSRFIGVRRINADETVVTASKEVDKKIEEPIIPQSPSSPEVPKKNAYKYEKRLNALWHKSLVETNPPTMPWATYYADGYWKFPLRFIIVVTPVALLSVAFLLYWAPLVNVPWAITSCIIVMSPQVGTTWRRFAYRALGTFIGALLGQITVVVAASTHKFVCWGPLIIVTFFCTYHQGMKYGRWAYLWMVSMLTFSIVVLSAWPFTPQSSTWTIAAYRFLMVFIGALIGTVGSLIFPEWSSERFYTVVRAAVTGSHKAIAHIHQSVALNQPLDQDMLDKLSLGLTVLNSQTVALRFDAAAEYILKPKRAETIRMLRYKVRDLCYAVRMQIFSVRTGFDTALTEYGQYFYDEAQVVNDFITKEVEYIDHQLKRKRRERLDVTTHEFRKAMIQLEESLLPIKEHATPLRCMSISSHVTSFRFFCVVLNDIGRIADHGF